jgi:hypothetical protein
LQATHPIEQSAPTAQFGRRALLDNAAFAKNDELVELCHGR